MQEKLKTKIRDFYDKNKEFVVSPFTYTGEINERGKDLFKGIELKNKKVLEVGCGHGHVISYCKKKGGTCKAFDISTNAINIAKKNYSGIKFFVDDIESLSKIRREKFDIVIILEVLEHTIDYKKTLKILNSLLEDGGIIILSCPNYFNSCGLIKFFSELFIGKNKWAPFAEWKEEENESFLTYPLIRKEIEKNFVIKSMETIDIYRGVFPFSYLKYSYEKNRINTIIRRFLESKKDSIFLRYFGSNIILRGVKK